MKEVKGRLAVNQEGMLAETNELDITKIDKLAELKGEVT